MCVFIVSASSGQKPQFSANFDIFGSSCTDPLYRWGPNLVSYSRPTVYVYLRNFVSIGLFCRPVAAKKKPIFAVFWTSATVTLAISGVANWQQSEIVEHGSQLQTFAYPTVSKMFCTPTLSWRNRAHNLRRSKAWRTNTQTNKQKKLNDLGCPGSGWNSSPTKLAMAIEDLEHVLAPLKLLGVRCSFTARGRWKFGGNQTPST